MPFRAQVLQVLIASPGDTRPYRDIVEQALYDWNRSQGRSAETIYLPRRWEFDTVPTFGVDAQSVVNEQIVDAADLVIGLFWHRIGMATARAASGSIEEIERCRAAGKSVHLLFGTMHVPHNVDLDQLKQVRHYQQEVAALGLMGQYASDADLVSQVRRVLDYHAETRRARPTPQAESPAPASPTVARAGKPSYDPNLSVNDWLKYEIVRERSKNALRGTLLATSSPLPPPLTVELADGKHLFLRNVQEDGESAFIREIHAFKDISTSPGMLQEVLEFDELELESGGIRPLTLIKEPPLVDAVNFTIEVVYRMSHSASRQSVAYYFARDF